MAAEAAEVANREDHVSADLLLQAQVDFMYLRALEVWIEIIHAECSARRRCIRQYLRKGWSSSVSWLQCVSVLANDGTSGGHPAEQGGINDAAIVHTVAATQNRLAVAINVQGEADTRSPILRVAGQGTCLDGLAAYRDRLRQVGVRAGQQLSIETHSEVNG